MGRLIDEDMLMERLGFLNTPQEREENAGQIITLEDFDSIPTAYDVDKVVEELTERSKEYNSGLRLHGKPEEMLTDEAIEIVKQGGVSDDVCEWHKVKNGNAYKCNTHAEIHDTRVLDWCRCPYCGKKIKVVERMTLDEAIAHAREVAKRQRDAQIKYLGD